MNRSTDLPFWLFCVLFLFHSSVTYSQQSTESGLPFIKNYTKKDYGVDWTFWSMEQDDRGIMYFGGDEILEFDGSNWRVINITNRTNNRAVSMKKGQNGCIYVGCFGDFGYLKEDQNGLVEYYSMLDEVPENSRNFPEIWAIEIMPDGIYFLADNILFRWDGESMDMIENGNRYHQMKKVGDRLLIRVWGKGLMEIKDMQMQLVPDGEEFADVRIYSMLPFDSEKILLGTRHNGLFILDQEGIEPFDVVTKSLHSFEVYWGNKLPNGHFALASFSEGIIIVDAEGRMLKRFNKEGGLKDETVSSLFVDREGDLWSTSFTSISRIEINSPFTFYNDNHGLPGPTVYETIRHNGTLYIGTNDGVFYLDPEANKFRRISNTTGQFYDFQVFKGKLLAAGGFMGLIEIQEKNYISIRPSVNYDFRLESIQISKSNPNRIFLTTGSGSGFASMVFKKDSNGRETWIEEGIINNVVGMSSFGLTEDDKGRLWISGQLKQAIVEEEDGFLNYETLSFDTLAHLINKPSGAILAIAPTPGNHTLKPLYFLAENGVYFLDGENKFVEEDRFPFPFDIYKFVNLQFPADHRGRLWMNTGMGLFVATKSESGEIKFITAPFERFRNRYNWTIFVEPSPSNGTVAWIGSPEGLLRYEGNVEEYTVNENLSTFIRGIWVNQDSLVYGGGGSIRDQYSLEPDENNLTFQYGSLAYDEPEATQYQTFLVGQDKGWSNWTLASSREYLNLDPGDYTFRVRSRDVNQTISREDSVQLTVAYPWYTTWWAWVIYVVLSGWVVYLIVQFRTRQLTHQREELEDMIAARTKEVEMKVEELSTVNQISQAVTTQLELKDLIEMVGKQMQKVFTGNIGYLALLDKETNIVNFPFTYGEDLKPLKLGEGLTSKVIQEGKPLLINEDVTGNVERFGLEFVGAVVASYLGVPIKSGNEIIGVLSVQSTDPENRFNERDLDLLNTIATHVGIAIHNAQLYQEAKEAKASAEDANEAKSSFLSTVSHELRTPLTSVLGFAKIVKKRLEDRVFPYVNSDDKKVQKAIAQVSDNLQVIRTEGERLTQLINDVLDLAKIESGQIEWHMSSLQFGEVIRRAIDATTSLFDEKKLKLETDIAPDLPEITGDENKLLQVMINLISNAVKFTDKGKVRIGVMVSESTGDDDPLPKPKELVVSVQDTGIGIAPEDQSRVFEKFKQVGDTLTDKPEGTGLGLPICKEIVEYHGGTIWVESESQNGSIFRFKLPLVKTESQGLETFKLDNLVEQLRGHLPVDAPKSNGEASTILVVDDDNPIRALLREELTEAGYIVREAVNGRQAIETVREAIPDLIILDVMMPEMNGFDVAAVLKNDPKTMDIPIIILSIVQDEERGMRIGVDRYLTKPIDTDALFSEVDSLLEQGQSRRKVLIVDENESTVKTLAGVLESRGYHVAESNGEELLKKAKETLPDIIVLNSTIKDKGDIVKSLRFEKGLERVLFLVYQ